MNNNFKDSLNSLSELAHANALAGSLDPQEADIVRCNYETFKEMFMRDFEPKQQYTADINMPVLRLHHSGVPVLTGTITNDSKDRALDGEYIRSSQVQVITVDDKGFLVVQTSNSVYRCLDSIKLDFGSGKVG